MDQFHFRQAPNKRRPAKTQSVRPFFGGLSRISLFLLGFSALTQPILAQEADITAPDNAAEELPAPKKAPAPWPEVRSKKIGVPSSKPGALIDVQIRPGPKTIKVPGAAAPAAAPDAPADMLDWYWQNVPHDVWGAAPERFAAALKALDHENRGQISKPSFQDVTSIAAKSGTDLLIHSIGTDVSPALALAVIAVESSGNTEAESGAGAQGLMQLIPDTAARFGVTDPFDPSQNIKGGITYLDWLLKEFKGDVVLALAGYNAGENAVKKHNGVPPFAETRAYVPKVLAAWEVAKGLCVTPPDLYSDGCVFATNALKASN